MYLSMQRYQMTKAMTNLQGSTSDYLLINDLTYSFRQNPLLFISVFLDIEKLV